MSEQKKDTSCVTSKRDAAGKATVTDLNAARESRKRKPRKAANRRFDHEKVARLKAAIEAGTYEIDYLSVADRFIEHERNAA